jgi:phage antirepressor YoqD-like protein
MARREALVNIVPEHNQTEIRNTYLEGASIAQISQDYHITQQAISNFIRGQGIMRSRGQGLKPRKARTIEPISDDIITQALQMVHDIGVVKTAKRLNVPQPQLSIVLKERGVLIRRGRPSSKVLISA